MPVLMSLFRTIIHYISKLVFWNHFSHCQHCCCLTPLVEAGISAKSAVWRHLPPLALRARAEPLAGRIRSHTYMRCKKSEVMASVGRLSHWEGFRPLHSFAPANWFLQVLKGAEPASIFRFKGHGAFTKLSWSGIRLFWNKYQLGTSRWMTQNVVGVPCPSE